VRNPSSTSSVTRAVDSANKRSRATEAARFRRPKGFFSATRYATGRPISRAISASAASRFSSGG
jgi:hypothetical protein